MTISSTESMPTPTRAHSAAMRPVAVTRAAAAVLWAIAFLAVLHGRMVPTGSDIPVSVGLLLAAYPLIDAAASLVEQRKGVPGTRAYAALVIDALAVLALLVAALTLHTDSVLIAFGTWAVVSGVLQFGHAWRARTSRRVQLPLLISGGISTIAGVSFAALAAQHTPQLVDLGGYAILGAVFFIVSTLMDRTSTR